MGYRIKYTDKWTGETKYHKFIGDERDARGWTETLARENKCKAECTEVEQSGRLRHVVSEGDSND